MTRDDWSFLLEKATALAMLVIGLDWLPQLIDVWIGGVGREDPAPRSAALHTFVPLAASAFLLMRRKPSAPAVVAAAPLTAAMGRADWLWVGCKIVGALAVLYGLGTFAVALGWTLTGLLTGTGRGGESLILIGTFVSSAIHVGGGAWLLFGDRVWRFACRR